MSSDSSQKFIQRNRAPRVQIEYDVETYGAQRKVELPFVMGVMSDLAGTPAKPLPPIEERKFVEVDVDNFDKRMEAIGPRVALQVPNKLAGEGNLSVAMTFKSMDDFSPDRVAEQVEPLRMLLELRKRLSLLVAYMDGKSTAETALLKLLGEKGKPEEMLSYLQAKPGVSEQGAKAESGANLFSSISANEEFKKLLGGVVKKANEKA